MPDISSFLIAFSLGLFSTLHCWGMCGGIIAAFSLNLPASVRGSRSQLLLYAGSFNIGRISSYTLAGLVAGLAGDLVTAGRAGTGLMFLQWLAGLVLIVVGLRMAGWVGGLNFLERAGHRIWQYIQPLGRSLLPLDHAGKALLMGMIWGWLPCGLVYSALLFALAQGNAVSGAGVMLAFGLGTLPGMIGAAFVGGRFQHWLRQPGLRRFAGIILIAFGLLVPLSHLPVFHSGSHGAHHSHQH